MQDLILALEYLGTGLGIAGALLVALKTRLGFLCWIIGNLAWVLYGWFTSQYGLLAQFSAFEIIAWVGWINWKET